MYNELISNKSVLHISRQEPELWAGLRRANYYFRQVSDLPAENGGMIICILTKLNKNYFTFLSKVVAKIQLNKIILF